jgi:tetratricopeptide (TPR) repeat protein
MMRPTLWPLKATATLLIGLSTALVAWRLFFVLEKRGATERGRHYLKSDANITNLETVSTWFKNGREDAALKLSNLTFSQDGRQRLETVSYWFGQEYSDAEGRLASAFVSLGRNSEAYDHFHNAVRAFGDHYTNSTTANNFAWMLAASSDSHLRNGAEAVHLAEMACEATQYKVPTMIGTLAAAYAEAGKFNDAILAGRKARQLALETGQKDIASKNEELLQWYEAGKAYHEAGEAGPPSTSQ